jgi:hypothetical protein
MYAAKREPVKLVLSYKPYVKRHGFPRVCSRTGGSDVPICEDCKQEWEKRREA